MNKRKFLFFSLFALAGLIASACGAAEYVCEDDLGCVTYGPDEPIRIASALVITGPDAQLGIDSQYGVEIAIDLKGDVLGHSVELQAEDDGCSSEGGQAAGQKVVSDPSIIAVVGTSCSGAGVPMSSVISEAGYAMVSPSNTSPMLTDPDQAWNAGYLRTAHNDKVQGAAMADYVYGELGLRTAATVHDGDPYTSGLVTAFGDAFEALGGSITFTTAINKGDVDMLPVLTSIAAAGSPDLLYFPLFTAECALMAKQAADFADLEGTTLASADGCFSAAAAEAIGEAGEGMVFSGPDLAFAGDFYEDEFKPAYLENYGTEPLSVFHAHAFDAANMILGCIEEVADVDDDNTIHVGRQALRDCLYATADFAGITGNLTCDQYGDCADPKISVSVMESGEYVRIWP
ncbi:MAG: branched-chain amino acid ABC transporter substrate-binding protein [Chloroflexota bacterium]